MFDLNGFNEIETILIALLLAKAKSSLSFELKKV